MNELIESIFSNFSVDKISIPVSFLHYEGHGEPYVVYMQEDCNNSISGDDELLGYVIYYDFDIYSKGNNTRIIDEIKKKMKDNGFVFQPSKSRGTVYEVETEYYHSTLNFAYIKEEL